MLVAQGGGYGKPVSSFTKTMGEMCYFGYNLGFFLVLPYRTISPYQTISVRISSVSD